MMSDTGKGSVKKKHPDLQIYRPGRKQSREKVDQEVEQLTHKVNKSSIQSDSDESRKQKLKRPELQRYVPKASLSASDESPEKPDSRRTSPPRNHANIPGLDKDVIRNRNNDSRSESSNYQKGNSTKSSTRGRSRGRGQVHQDSQVARVKSHGPANESIRGRGRVVNEHSAFIRNRLVSGEEKSDDSNTSLEWDHHGTELGPDAHDSDDFLGTVFVNKNYQKHINEFDIQPVAYKQRKQTSRDLPDVDHSLKNRGVSNFDKRDKDKNKLDNREILKHTRSGKATGRRNSGKRNSRENAETKQQSGVGKGGQTSAVPKSQQAPHVHFAEESYPSHSRGYSDRSRSSESEGLEPKGGGILHLHPEKINTNTDIPHHNYHSVATRGASRGRGRGGSHRILYDPKNPDKSSSSPNASMPTLQFKDPTEPMNPTHQQDGYPENVMYQQYIQHMNSAGNMSGQFPIQFSGGAMPNWAGHYSDYFQMDEAGFRDPFYLRDYSSGNQRMGPDGQEASDILNNACALNQQLYYFLPHAFSSQQSLGQLMKMREDLRTQLEQVIVQDLDLTIRMHVEQMLWKAVYYQLIEMLRQMFAHHQPHGSQSEPPKLSESEQKAKDTLLMILNEGQIFYEELIKKLEKVYQFNVDDYMNPSKPVPENPPRMVKLAKLCVQRMMINLGDIARYKTQASNQHNFGTSRRYYLNAQLIEPKNGRPYNQLAILALYARRKLDAIYYYMRSLAASNPFTTAREGLMALFDEARRKAEQTENKRILDKKNYDERLRKLSEVGDRVEIWIHNDGSSSKGQMQRNLDDDLKNLSPIDLNKRFIVTFQNVHGKLFSKIGMDTFPPVFSQMLTEFSVLLSHDPAPIGNTRLLQLMAINMYTVENTVVSDSSHLLEMNCRPLIQEQAVNVGLHMFGLLLERCIILFNEHLRSNLAQVMNDDLRTYIPSVKVWCDWMACHTQFWNPPPNVTSPDFRPVINVWNNIAEFINVLNNVDTSHVKFYTEKREGCEELPLLEDTTMLGFIPMMGFPRLKTYVHATVDKDVAADCLRIEQIKIFGDYLCGVDDPLLEFDVHQQKYKSIAPVYASEKTDSEDPDVILEGEEMVEDEEVCIDNDEEEAGSGDEEQIQRLRARKQELRAKQAEKTKQQKSINEVLASGSKHNTTHIEVHPTFLVPDTNCFIDHLPDIQILLKAKAFNVMVPLIVINELDGLSRGSREGQYESAAHAQKVQVNSGAAIRYLEEEFCRGNPALKAVTAKGNRLDTIAFRSEEPNDNGNNDDVILRCCQSFFKDNARDFMPKDEFSPVTLKRDVVLLTDDRNLHLKAHTMNVPVRDLPSFLVWSKVP